MNKTKKKDFVVLFVVFLFALTAYFNAYMIFKPNREEILSVVSGETSVSEAPKVALNSIEKYYEFFFKKKEDVTKFVRIDRFIDLYGLIQKTIKSDIVIAKNPNETVMRLKNGSLALGDALNFIDFSSNAAEIKDFSEWLGRNDVDFLLAQAASKEITQENAPDGVVPPPKRVSDSIAESLYKNELTFLELKRNPELSTDMLETYYVTDHHWTTRTGFSSAGYIVNEINRLYGYNIDVGILDADNFRSEMYNDIFLGSTGKKVGIPFAGRDDFELLLPKNETSFTVDITHLNNEKEIRKGSFENTLVFRQNLKWDYYDYNVYCTYMGGDYPIATIENNNTDSDKSILVIKDSYANVVVPFLAMTVKKVTVIDPRQFDSSIKEYIESNRPDMVLLIYNSGAFFGKEFCSIK